MLATGWAQQNTSFPPPALQILLVGDSGVGKSSLLLRFATGGFEEVRLGTLGILRDCTAIHGAMQQHALLTIQAKWVAHPWRAVAAAAGRSC